MVLMRSILKCMEVTEWVDTAEYNLIEALTFPFYSYGTLSACKMPSLFSGSCDFASCSSLSCVFFFSYSFVAILYLQLMQNFCPTRKAINNFNYYRYQKETEKLEQDQNLQKVG